MAFSGYLIAFASSIAEKHTYVAQGTLTCFSVQHVYRRTCSSLAIQANVVEDRGHKLAAASGIISGVAILMVTTSQREHVVASLSHALEGWLWISLGFLWCHTTLVRMSIRVASTRNNEYSCILNARVHTSLLYKCNPGAGAQGVPGAPACGVPFPPCAPWPFPSASFDARWLPDVSK